MAHEVSEHIEHAGHDHGGGGSLTRWIGITIAILGVVMALCSAQVGAARTEFIATMVEENGAELRYQTVSSKLRMLQAQLQQLHALLPDPKEYAETEAELKKIETEAKNPETVQVIKVTRLETKKILNTVTPTHEDMLRFATLIERHEEEAEAAKEWSESYKDAIHAHSDTAERFEIAMLSAEIGIVIASVGLLLAKQIWFARGAWGIAVLLGVLSITIATGTKIVNTQMLDGANEKIRHTKTHFMEMSNDNKDAAEDKKLIEDIKKEKSTSE